MRQFRGIFTEISRDMSASFNLSEDPCSLTINEFVICEQHGEMKIELNSPLNKLYVMFGEYLRR